MSPSEAAELIRAIETACERSPLAPADLLESLRTLASQDDGREFYMVNLIRHRERAAYPAGAGYDEDVAAAERRYATAVLPALLKRGSIPILVAEPVGTFLQPAGGQTWDQVAIVRYRSRRDMLEVALELAHKGAGAHKWASVCTLIS